MSGLRDLRELIQSMRPDQVPGEYVFVSVNVASAELAAKAMVCEAEGVTYVIERGEADARGLIYDFVAAWITLNVHSALDAVGLTAAVCTALTDAGISCNVLAGRFHDHLLVPYERADQAIEVLKHLATAET